MAIKKKIKKCEKAHVEDIGTWQFNSYTYLKHESNIFIDAYSVFRMLTKAGLKNQAVEFMNSVADLRRKDQ